MQSPPIWPRVVTVIAISWGIFQFAVLSFVLLTWLGVFAFAFPAIVSANRQLDTETTVETPAPPTGGTVDSYYQQDLVWSQCSTEQVSTDSSGAPSDIENYQCTTFYVPLDWNAPDGETITLTMAKHVSDQSGGNALFFNLGGPGASSVDSLAWMVNDQFGADVVDAYDIVALDPRGVGASTPLKCMTDAERDQWNNDVTTAEEAAMSYEEKAEKARQEAVDYAAGCQTHSGDLYKYVDTVSVARDFDVARALMGQNTLNYVGYSYGTFLGATYAEQFPDMVGRFILDSAVDPAVDINTLSELQMRGFEASLRHWVEVCQQTSTCPFDGTVDEAMQQIADFFSRIEKQPLPTSDPDRPLTIGLASTAIIGTLYSTDTYEMLQQGLSQALLDGDGSTLLFIADILNERNFDGTYDGSGSDALVAVNSLDMEPVGTVEEWVAQVKKVEEELTVMGRFMGWSSASLEGWPTQHASRGPITAAGAAPIVVIGVTNDPATPYVMAQSLADQLESGVLVTWEGWSHGAYSKDGSSCVSDAVEGYLLDGTVPNDGLVCTD